MLRIYYSSIEPYKVKDLIEVFGSKLSNHTLYKTHNYKTEDDKKRCILGELLLHYSVKRILGYKNHELEIYQEKYGKPYVKDNIVYFNISHSGEYVMCAISSKELGIDIEKHIEITENIFRFFHEKERDYLNKVGKINRFFFDLWTQKESYIKYLGTGLNTPLDSFYIANGKNGASVYDNYGRRDKVYLQSLSIDKSYSCTVCSEVKEVTCLTKIYKKDLNHLNQ
ncbi:4'-phosphopantetheinyl transferase family protein [Marinilactibacillus psychrotolerans]|uniref:4'-phosphopantetheinyl transferase family protein n=1 Tax=Marinilactibacillus psychrotolerans TaxID=191770 RepID=UPI00388383EA